MDGIAREQGRPRLRARLASGFSLTELLVTIAVVAILATLVVAAVSKSRLSASRTACQNNLRQIALAIRLYADDMNDVGPSSTAVPKRSLDSWTAYKQLLGSYVTRSATGTKLFTCPADTYHYSFTVASPTVYAYIAEPVCRQPWSEHSSYAFNGGNARTNITTGNTCPGIAGIKLSAVRHPSRTVLIAEYPAYFCFSWHAPQHPTLPHYLNDAQNVVAFVDGHVRYTRMFYDPTKGQAEAWQYDPPASYDYQWSAE